MSNIVSLDLERFGRHIRDRRMAIGLTQIKLAERVGWSQERISALEHGKYGMPSLQGLVRLAGALELSLGHLIRAAGYEDPAADSSSSSRESTENALFYSLQRLLAIDAATLVDALNDGSDVLAQVMGADKIDARATSRRTTAWSPSARARHRWAAASMNWGSSTNR
jgi:transcriptional regulator with XRE-family HTH domain